MVWWFGGQELLPPSGASLRFLLMVWAGALARRYRWLKRRATSGYSIGLWQAGQHLCSYESDLRDDFELENSVDARSRFLRRKWLIPEFFADGVALVLEKILISTCYLARIPKSLPYRFQRELREGIDILYIKTKRLIGG